MPGADIAEYGITFFTVVGLIYLVTHWFKQRFEDLVFSRSN